MNIETGTRVSLIVNGKPSRAKNNQGTVKTGNYLKSLVEFDGEHGATEWIENSRLHIVSK